MALSEQQARFVVGIVKGLNGKDAAIFAGYKASNANHQACVLRKDPAIREAIREGMDAEGLTLDRAMHELKGIAYSNIFDYITIDKRGNIQLKAGIGETLTGAISSIAVGKDGFRIRTHNKENALKFLIDHLKDSEVDTSNPPGFIVKRSSDV